jgi:hypothetical protein
LTWLPVGPQALPARLADWIARTPGIVRVAVDGPDCAAPDDLASALARELPSLGRPAAAIAARLFWRDASLRLEHGREDPDSYLSWLDVSALRREVLDAVRDRGRYLPSLRDPATNRSTREPPIDAQPGQVLLVSGALLLGRDLPFDRTVHLAMSAAARLRHTSPDQAWTLPALDRYDARVRPVEVADAVVKLDDPRHPAVRYQGA